MDIMSESRTFNDKFMLRLPDGMRDQLKEAASKSGRSMNSEIVARLQRSLMSPDEIAKADMYEMAADSRRRLERLEELISERDLEAELDRIMEKIVKEAIIKNRKPE